MPNTLEQPSQSSVVTSNPEKASGLYAAREWICHKVGAFAARTSMALVFAAGAGSVAGVAAEMTEQPQPAAAAARACGELMVAGSSWLGGLGVDARANGPSQPDLNSCGGQGPYGNQWQCLELVSHLLSARGWYNGLSGVGIAKNLYPYTAEGKYPGLTVRANGSGYKPVPGDVIVHSNGGGGAGHVTIVDRYDNSTLYAVEQNGDTDGRTEYSYNPNTGAVSKPGANIPGYVHAERNTNSSGGGSSQAVGGNGRADFNGDGRSDFVVRQGNTWTVRTGGGAGIAEGLQLGDANAKPLVGDVNGDGRSDFVTYSNGNWTAWSGAWPNLPVSQGVQNGNASSVPLLGDVNGDGRKDFIAFEGGQWNVKAGDGTPLALGVQRGPANATPLVGDVNGDGKDDIISYDRGTWAAWNATGSNDPITQGLQFGGPNSTPMVGDADGNGRADLVIREGNTWYIRDRSGAPIAQGMQRGSGTSTPFMGDVGGDGRADLVTFESSNGAWLAWNSTGANDPVSQGVSFGAGGVGLTG